MSNLTLGETTIRQLDGLYSLNDLHQAAGGDSKHQPSNFLRLEQTQALVTELSNSSDVRNYEPVKSVRGKHGGTYVCRELVIAYAAWISPTFHLKVIRHFLDTKVGSGETDAPKLLPPPAADTLLIGKRLLVEFLPGGGTTSQILDADVWIFRKADLYELLERAGQAVVPLAAAQAIRTAAKALG